MKKLPIIVSIILAILILAEIVLVKSHGESVSWVHLKGMSAFLGLSGALILLPGAKWVGKSFLYRKDDYYNE